MSKKRGWQVTKSPPLNPPLDREVLGDFFYWRSGVDLVQNIVWNWHVKSLTVYVKNGGTFWHSDVESSSNIMWIVNEDYKKDVNVKYWGE